jgi:hypothetical protein
MNVLGLNLDRDTGAPAKPSQKAAYAAIRKRCTAP